MKPVLFPDLLCEAYSLGYFPMPDPQTGEIVFLRPDPRAVLPLDGFHLSRSLKKEIRRSEFEISFSQSFKKVMEACADREDTWITEEFFVGYQALHEVGHAHSVEVWRGKDLVGGLYGVTCGGAFFAESKFHRATNASKIALYYLVKYLKELDFQLLEVQFQTPHLKSLGVIEISDEAYQLQLSQAVDHLTKFKPKPRFMPNDYPR